ncbi:MAG: LamG domain-containing protein [bacterium]|nr:LamG domain-containing protein [bacterium]
MDAHFYTKCWSLILLLLASSVGAEEEGKLVEQVVWDLDNLESIGGHSVTVEGRPKVIETAKGKALEFDGEDDGIFLDAHPLAGASTFTVEVIFQPYPNGLKEQRFFHMQEREGEERVMFETRLTADDRWFLDAFIQSGEGNYVLYAEDFKHPIGPWYQAAIVVDGKEMRHYVNGKLEMKREVTYEAQTQGRTSLGVRINKVYWYKGAIRQARFTPWVLKPEEFLQP